MVAGRRAGTPTGILTVENRGQRLAGEIRNGERVGEPGRIASQTPEAGVTDRIDTTVGQQERIHRKLVEGDHDHRRVLHGLRWRRHRERPQNQHDHP